MIDDQYCDKLVRLDRKMSRALATGNGMRFTAAELDIMTAIGAMAILSEAKAKALKAQASARQQRDARLGVGHAAPRQTANADVSQARARARQIFE